MRSKYFEMSSLGKFQTETMGWPGLSGFLYFGKEINDEGWGYSNEKVDSGGIGQKKGRSWMLGEARCC